MSLKIFNLTEFQCPDTIMMLKIKIKNIHFSNKILILTNDISTKWEIPLFCHFMDYKIIDKKFQNKPYQFLIQKKISK